MSDIATALTQSVARDGQTTYTGNQSMGGFRHTQVANGTARDQYTTVAQVQDGNLTLIGSLSGTDTLTGAISPAITAYANGVFLTMIPVNTNTGPVTLALNGLAARPVLKQNGAALIAGDLLAGVPATLVYNGTSFYLENPGNLATINGAPVADFARLSVANVFTSVAGGTSYPIKLESPATGIAWNDTGAAVDNRLWDAIAVGEQFSWRAKNDAGTSASPYLVINRTGTTVDSIALAATNITLNGVNVTDYARLSTSTTFTSGSVRASGGTPDIGVIESDQGVDGKNWLWIANGGSFSLAAYNDALSISSVAISVTRSGMTIANTAIAGNTVTINGQNANTPALFTSGTLADARVAQSNVTQHQAALALNASQVTAVPGDLSTSAAVNASLAGRILTVTNASTITLTVSSNCLGGDGKAALFIRRGTGAVVFAASGVTIRSPGGGTSITIQHGKVALIQMSSTEFELAGNV